MVIELELLLFVSEFYRKTTAYLEANCAHFKGRRE
jgi:hypothetical protein